MISTKAIEASTIDMIITVFSEEDWVFSANTPDLNSSPFGVVNLLDLGVWGVWGIFER
jgi:hypothetical protein